MRPRSILTLGLVLVAGTVGFAHACDGEGKRAAMRETADASFVEADADGSGALDQAEFTHFGEIMHAKMAARRFERADANGDGAVTKDELANARPRRHRMGSPL